MRNSIAIVAIVVAIGFSATAQENSQSTLSPTGGSGVAAPETSTTGPRTPIDRATGSIPGESAGGLRSAPPDPGTLASPPTRTPNAR